MTRCLAIVPLLCGACLNPVSVGGSGTSTGAGVGVGVGSTGGGPACLPVSPGSLDFRDVAVGQSSTLPIVFTNCGSGPEQLTVDAPIGPLASEFSCASIAGQPLAAGQSVTLQVTFAPTATGPASPGLPFTACSGCASQVRLGGNGVASAGAGGSTGG